MFQQHITSVWEPPASKFFKGHRPTVAILLITPNRGGVVLAEHENGPAYTFIPPQGDIRPHEAVGSALLREVKEELPGVELELGSFTLLGDCVNEMPAERGEQPDKWMFWIAARCSILPAQVSSKEIKGIDTAWSPEHLKGFFMAGQVRRKKRQMILEAVRIASFRGLLSWNCSDAPVFAVEDHISAQVAAVA